MKPKQKDLVAALVAALENSNALQKRRVEAMEKIAAYLAKNDQQ
jgi:hypothetical protein